MTLSGVAMIEIPRVLRSIHVPTTPKASRVADPPWGDSIPELSSMLLPWQWRAVTATRECRHDTRNTAALLQQEANFIRMPTMLQHVDFDW